jgi:hypothetical protein
MTSRKLKYQYLKKNKTIKTKMNKTSKSMKTTVKNMPVEKTIERVKLPRIITKTLGKETGSYTSKSIAPVCQDELQKFIKEEITDGPQIVSIPVPPYRHAFLVDVQPKKIMISDWGGKKNKTAGILGNKNYQAGWEQYSDLMIKLEEKYNRPVQYYAINRNLYKISNNLNTQRGGGGCSYYIYEWVKDHYPNYKS